MSRPVYHPTSPSRAPRRARPKNGPTMERGGYLTVETVTLWIVYALTILGNALIEGGQLAGTTSASVSYAVFAWFTPAGYVFSIWSLIYVALIVWLVAYTKAAPSRPRGFNTTSILFIVSSVLNVGWLAIWHFDQVALSFVVILADWVVLAALYLNVRNTAATRAGRVPIAIYSAWITVATLANMAILITRILDGGIPILNELSVVALTAGVLALGYALYHTYHEIAFPLVFLWALIGVGVHVAEASIPTAVIVFVLTALGAVLTFAPLEKLRSSVPHSRA